MEKKIYMVLLLLALLLALAAQTKAEYSPGDQSLMLIPTAYTMPAGSHAITDYEVIFIQYAYSFNGNTHLSVMSLLPIVKDFHKSLTIGAKQRYLVRGMVQSSAFGSYIPESGTVIIGNVVSLGQPSTSLHLGLAYGWGGGGGMDAPILFLGARKNVSRKVAFMAEFGSTFSTHDDAIESIASFGIRLSSDTISWDLGGFRPVGADVDMGSFYVYPVLKATFEF